LKRHIDESKIQKPGQSLSKSEEEVSKSKNVDQTRISGISSSQQNETEILNRQLNNLTE
jgi:hypothetical protein